MTGENKGNLERLGSTTGGLAGKVGDAAVDIMGSMIRTVAGSVGGWWSERTPDDAEATFDDTAERSCRQHFENVRRNTSYDAVRPLYQFGHLAGQNPDYQGRSFEEVESDLRNSWTDEKAQTYGSWDTVRDYVNTGYSGRRQ
jgi:hypothetical protein